MESVKDGQIFDSTLETAVFKNGGRCCLWDPWTGAWCLFWLPLCVGSLGRRQCVVTLLFSVFGLFAFAHHGSSACCPDCSTAHTTSAERRRCLRKRMFHERVVIRGWVVDLADRYRVLQVLRALSNVEDAKKEAKCNRSLLKQKDE